MLLLYSISSQRNHTAADMGSFSEDGWEWNLLWRRNLFDHETEIASKFIDLISMTRLNSNLNDTWVWRADISGNFSTKSAYQLLKDEQSSEVQYLAFRQLWDIKIPPRALSFAWRLLWDRLPTKDNLAKRQILINNDLCPFCNSKPESAPHLFFTCDKIQPLWWEFLSWVKEDRTIHCRPMDNFLQHAPTVGNRTVGRRWKIWWLAATASIWKVRNDIVFQNQSFDISKLADNTLFLMWTWLKGWEKDFTVPFTQWSSAMSLVFI